MLRTIVSRASSTLCRKRTQRSFSALRVRLVHSHHKRHFALSSTPLRPFDDLPSSTVPNEEVGRILTDSLSFMNEQYAIAQAADSQMLRMNALGSTSVFLFSHDLVKQWQGYELRGQTKRHVPPPFDKLAGKAFSDMHGQEHAEWKKKAMRSFKPSMLDLYIPSIQRSVQDVVLKGMFDESQASGEAVHFNPMAKRFAYDIGSNFVWGPLISDEERPLSYELFKGVTHINTAELFNDIEAKEPDSEMSRVLRAKDELNAFLGDKFLTAQRLVRDDAWEATFPGTDCMLRGMLENDAIFDPRGDYDLFDKVDLVQGLTTAAYETTATTLTNLMFCMSQFPEETEKVRRAILSHPELSDPHAPLSFATLKDCNELECFIAEANRVHGIAPVLLDREVAAEDGLEIGGYHMPKGTQLSIPVKWLHLGEGSWSETDEFRPARHDKSDGRSKAERGDLGRYNNIPFATGLHKCLGQNLAMLELRMYSVLLLREYDFALDESQLSAEGTVNGMQLQQGIPHFNVFLKLFKRSQ